MMQTCIEITVGGMTHKVEQRKNGLFRVTYWLQVEDLLTYAEAAKRFGENIFHALACEGKLDMVEEE